MSVLKCTLVVLLLSGTEVAFCQVIGNNDFGLPYIQNYLPEEYDGESQNWAVVQSKNGIIYSCVSDYVLEYDGVSWGKILVGSTTRSLAVVEDGTLYVGGQGDLGYLAPDSAQQLRFVSLKHKIDTSYHDFSDVWQVFTAGDTIYYTTTKYIFRFHKENIKVWETESLFYPSFFVNDRFYVRHWKVGLMELVDDSLKLVPGGDQLVKVNVQTMLPYGSGRALIGTLDQGLFVLDNTSIEPLNTINNEFLVESQIYHGTMLSDSTYALATLNSGLVIINRKGTLLKNINTTTGLNTDKVHFVYSDDQGGLWLALDRGLARVEVPSRFSRYDRSSGLNGIVLSILRQNEVLYVGTTEGLYYLDRSPTGKKSFELKFKPISDLKRQCWSLLSIDESILVATNRGVYRIESQQAVGQLTSGFSYVLYPSTDNSTTKVYVGRIDGLGSLGFSNGAWHEQTDITDVDQEIRSLFEDPYGYLWAETRHDGILRIHVKDAKVERFNQSHGLPNDNGNYLFSVNDEMRLATAAGVFLFDEKQEHFIPDDSFGLDSSSWVFRAQETTEGNIWLYTDDEICLAQPQADGAYSIQHSPFQRIPKSLVEVIYPEESGLTWFGSANGILRYDPDVIDGRGANAKTLIRDVRVNAELKRQERGEDIIDEIPYEGNFIRFKYAIPAFTNSEANQYQYLLDGYDKSWSNWSNETYKDYTNLSEGNYEFHVRGKDVYGAIWEEDSRQFSILPPWYRTWWAYCSYFVLSIFTIVGFVKWRSSQLQHDKEVLEGIIKERTEEVALKNEQLKEMDRLKSRFFANISHEFRTPLTLILGPLKELSQDSDGIIAKSEHVVMRSNADKLLRLVNQILALSKLEAGSLSLHASKNNLIPFLKGAVMSFESLAKSREIELNLEIENDGTKLYFDQEKLEQVLFNLLSNAFKFTPKQGSVTVISRNIEVRKNDGLQQHVEIIIKDTGEGIPEDQLRFVFDRFYQVDGSSVRQHEGSGIGLALVKELIKLHKGEIKVTSIVDSGTEVSVLLPLGAGHLKPEEIIEPNIDVAAVQPFSTEPPDPLNKDHDHEGLSRADGNAKDVILVVEDNTDVRSYIIKHLIPTYSIIEASNGAAGVEMALSAVPTLVISDVMMPEMDGYQLTHALKSDIRTSHIPVILLTAKASQDNKIEGLETGADDYLIKPFDSKELKVRIKNLIEQRAKLRESFGRDTLLLPKAISTSSMDEKFLKKAFATIEEYLSDETLNTQRLCEEMAMSRTGVHEKIKALTGQSTSQFIRSVRLKHAAELMKKRTATVTEIAYRVGFNNISYFAKCFKEQFGVLPSAYISTKP